MIHLKLLQARGPSIRTVSSFYYILVKIHREGILSSPHRYQSNLIVVRQYVDLNAFLFKKKSHFLLSHRLTVPNTIVVFCS